MSEEKKEVRVMTKQEMEFALTPAGQEAKAFEVLQRKGMMFASSSIVPERYKGNVGDCVIALEMAQRMNAMPLMIMQNLYVVHGTPSFSSKFLVACINASKRFSPLRYEFKGKEGANDYGCRVYAYEADDKEKKEPLYGDWITWDMANKEGWVGKAGSKWKTMPNQMFRYRAAAFWQRVYCPEISMGLITTEEVEDMGYTEYTEVKDNETQSISDQLAQAMKESEVKKEEEVLVDPNTGELFPNVK